LSGVRLVLLGPPGAGKGTQAKLLQERFRACQISTGDILRKAVADQTALGKDAAEYLKRGALVPDEVIINLVADRLQAKDCENGFVLDGFPRTIQQAGGLEAILKTLGMPLEHVLSMRVPPEAIVKRLAGRRICGKCGALYHELFDPPKNAGLCDRCGEGLYQREDDREETITTRLKVYEEQTAPLIQHYRERGKLRTIDGVGRVEDIQRRIIESLCLQNS
jgi:adenylate kinase